MNLKVLVSGNSQENIKAIVVSCKRWGESGKPYGTIQELRSGDRSIIIEMGANSNEYQQEFPEGNFKVTIKLQDGHLTASWEEE